MVNKTTKLILISFIVCNLKIYGQIQNESKLDPVIKSLIIPGWGQKALGKPKRARVFNYIESGILITLISTSTFSNIEKKNYIAFASKHAAISSSGKNHKYWVDIGNYLNYIDYNQEHLRFRESEDLYLSDYQWSWDSDINRNKFKRMRIKADLMKRRINFIFGAIIINHIISSIDVHYLNGLKNKTSLYIDPQSKDLNFKYEF